MQDYIVETNTLGNEEVYVYDNVIYDIIQGKIVLRVKRPVAFQYWRRTDKYSVGYQVFAIVISPNLQPFKLKHDTDEKINLVKSNWKDFVRITLMKMYPEDLFIKMTESIAYAKNYLELVPNNKTELVTDIYAYHYFKNNYPELKHFYLYNGYSSNECLGYYEIP